MTRASWGSTSGDMSGLFVGLMDENRRRIEASVEREIQRSKEQQNAEDNEKYDQWQNGLISDERWLKYVKRRVDETKGDPEEHQQWRETYREHRDAIKDAQMEAAYEAGRLSLHKLIAHYSDRMSGIERNSPEYRENSQRYWQLIDTRDSYYIEDESRRILNRISRGQAGYGELRDFYQSMLGKVRKSSPLYRQILDNLNSINTIGGSGGSGGSSGGSRSGGSYSGGSSGGGSGDRDPYSAASRTVLKLWRSGNVFVPAGEDVVRSVLDVYKMDVRDDTTVWNALAEDSVVIEQLLEKAIANPADKWIQTPWGDKIPNTVANRQLLMNQGLRGYDYRIALGNASGRSVLGVLSARDSFVEDTFQTVNEADATDYWRQVRQNFWERSELAAQNPSPRMALLEYEAAGEFFEKAARRILGERLSQNVVRDEESAGVEGDLKNRERIFLQSRLFPEEQVTPEMQEELRFAARVGEFFKGVRGMTPEELMHEASLLSDERPEGFWLTESDFESIVGTNRMYLDPEGFGVSPQAGTGVIGKAFAQRGIANMARLDRGEVVADTVTPYRYVAPVGAPAPQAVPLEAVNSILGVADYTDGSSVMGGWEKVGGEEVWVLRPLVDVPPPKWYFDSQGRALKPADYEKIGRDPAALAAAGYQPQEIAGLAGWKMLTDGDGQVWYRDPDDGHLYAGKPPFQQSAFGPIFNYGYFVGEDGTINMDNFRVPASTGRGVIAFFTSDVSPHRAQELTESIVDNPLDERIDLSYFHRRDDKNFVQVEGLTPDDIVGMFWTPMSGQFSPQNMGGTFAPSVKEAARESWLDMQEARRKAEIKNWIESRIGDARDQAAFRKYNPETNISAMAQDSINRAKAELGIRMGKELRDRRIEREGDFGVPRISEVAAPPSIKPIRPVPTRAPTVRRKPPRYTPDPTERIGGLREF